MRSHLYPQVALAGFCLAVLAAVPARANSSSTKAFPEIVRISYLEGDVRVSRGQDGGAPKDADWEKAVVNLPIQTGFYLATDEGRVEIELEDASTIYLAPHSVLLFNQLDSIGGSPQTQVGLLTGSVTLEVHPQKTNEYFILRTPTDTLAVTKGQRSDMRVTAYMDAIGLTPTVAGFIQVSPTILQAAIPGRTHYYRDGKQVDFTDPAGDAALKDWDKWVHNRMAERDAVMARMLKQTGLKEPVPGLAQLDGQGKFVDCAGYGSCWEPPAPAAAPKPLKSGNLNSMSTLLQPQDTAASTSGNATRPKKILASNPSGLTYDQASLMFPCGPDSMYYGLAMQAGYFPGMSGAYGYGYGYGFANNLSPWAYAVCHSGSWIYQDDRYLWVPGGSIQHFPPVHWIKHGGKVIFVPIHPADVTGKPPLNASHGILTDKGGHSFQRASIQPGSQFKVINDAPFAFQKPVTLSLPKSDAPRLEAHMFQPHETMMGENKHAHGDKSPQANAHTASNDRLRASALDHSGDVKAGHAGPVGVPLVFDHSSQSFMMSHQVLGGGNARTVSEPVDSYLARSGQTFGGHLSGQVGGSGFRGPEANPGMSYGRGSMGGNNGGFSGGASASRDGGGFSRGAGSGGNSGGFTPAGSGGGGGSSFSGGGGGGGASHAAPASAPAPSPK